MQPIFNKWAAFLIHPQIMSVSFPHQLHTSSLGPEPHGSCTLARVSCFQWVSEREVTIALRNSTSCPWRHSKGLNYACTMHLLLSKWIHTWMYNYWYFLCFINIPFVQLIKAIKCNMGSTLWIRKSVSRLLQGKLTKEINLMVAGMVGSSPFQFHHWRLWQEDCCWVWCQPGLQKWALISNYKIKWNEWGLGVEEINERFDWKQCKENKRKTSSWQRWISYSADFTKLRKYE